MNRRSFLKGIGVGLLALNSISGLKSVVETLAFFEKKLIKVTTEWIVPPLVESVYNALPLTKHFIAMKRKLADDVLLNDPRIVVTADGKVVWDGPSPYPDGLPPYVEINKIKSKSS